MPEVYPEVYPAPLQGSTTGDRVERQYHLLLNHPFTSFFLFQPAFFKAAKNTKDLTACFTYNSWVLGGYSVQGKPVVHLEFCTRGGKTTIEELQGGEAIHTVRVKKNFTYRSLCGTAAIKLRSNNAQTVLKMVHLW